MFFGYLVFQPFNVSISIFPHASYKLYTHTHTHKINDMSKYISLISTSKLVTSLFGDYIVIGIVWFITLSVLLLIFVNSYKIAFKPCQLGAVRFSWKDLLHLSSINGTVDERVNHIYFAIAISHSYRQCFAIQMDFPTPFSSFTVVVGQWP